MSPDSLDLIEEVVARVENTAGTKVVGASVIRSYSNRVLQWRAVLVVTRSEETHFQSKELNGYGRTGRDAIAAVTREAENLLKQWASSRSGGLSGV